MLYNYGENTIFDANISYINISTFYIISVKYFFILQYLYQYLDSVNEKIFKEFPVMLITLQLHI